MSLTLLENADWPELANLIRKNIPEGKEFTYRGRLAPSPTGYLHAGHLQTFETAQNRAREAGGILIYRLEDLDYQRCKPEYAKACHEDLASMGLAWDEGPDRGGPSEPYEQSQRMPFYLSAWKFLKDRGLIYPFPWSRSELEDLGATRDDEGDWILPDGLSAIAPKAETYDLPGEIPWRFKVAGFREINCTDRAVGFKEWKPGKDFGDFLVWRREGIPSYELAVVVDDILMKITEVVRGLDLLKSTARQLLLYESLGFEAPAFYHCPLVLDENGLKLSKRAKRSFEG